MAPDNKTMLGLFKDMLRIRLIEERIAHAYPEGKMRTPTHFSIGQEAVSVGVCACLNRKDAVFASHRCHAAYLARGGGLKEMLAELFGRANGACGGRSGSAHLACPGKNMYSAPILGAMSAVATGAALSFKLSGKVNISVSFIGDAALEEGVVTESINFALVKNLPVLFVCENNLFSTHTHIKYRQPDIPIYKRIKSLGIYACRIDGNDILQVYNTVKEAREKIIRGRGPAFIECLTYRYREHVGPNFDFNNPYRAKDEVDYWMNKRCPVKRFRGILFNNGVLTENMVNLFVKKINREVDEALEFAGNSPWPSKEDMLNNAY